MVDVIAAAVAPAFDGRTGCCVDVDGVDVEADAAAATAAVEGLFITFRICGWVIVSAAGSCVIRSCLVPTNQFIN